MLRYLAIVPLALVASPVAAQTVNFDEFITSSLWQFAALPFDSNGLHFEDPFSTASDAALFWGQYYSHNADFGGAALTSNYNDPITVTRVGGGTFNLKSFDLADQFNGGLGSFNVTFVDTLGTTSQVFSINGPPGLNKFKLNHNNLLSFTFGGPDPHGGSAQIDNIVYTTGAPSVPEPATWAMMLAGLGVAGSAMRRRTNHERALAA